MSHPHTPAASAAPPAPPPAPPPAEPPAERPAPPPRARPEPLGRALWVLAGTIVLGSSMPLLDTTAVNVALGTIGADLGSPLSVTQWLATGYLLVLAVVAPVSGWAVERFGSRRVWMFALGVFAAGSLGCGLAGSAGVLIGFRLLQGLGGGLIAPVAQTMLARAAGPSRMGRCMSILGTATVLGPVAGPVLGGGVSTALSWHWIFLINVPVGAVAILVAHRVLPRHEELAPRALDWRGLALAALGLAGLTYGLSQAGGPAGLVSAEVLVPVVAGVALLVAFVRYAVRRGPNALLSMRLFRDRSFSLSAAMLFGIGVMMFGALLLIPLYLAAVRGFGPFTTGLIMVAQGLGSAIAMPIVGRLVDRVGTRTVILPGLALIVAGTVFFAFSGPDTPVALLVTGLVLRGAGMGGVLMPTIASTYAALPKSAVPEATAVTTIVRQVGGSLGTALFATLLIDHASDALPGVSGGLGPVRAVHGVGAAAEQLAEAFDSTFWLLVGCTLIVAKLAFALIRRARRGRHTAAALATTTTEQGREE